VSHAQQDAEGNVRYLGTNVYNQTRSYVYDESGSLVGGSDFGGFDGIDRARWKGALYLAPDAGLYYMRARWYEPRSGRFLSEDPAGLARGLNPYIFAGADGINGADPTGMCTPPQVPDGMGGCIWVVGLIGGGTVTARPGSGGNDWYDVAWVPYAWAGPTAERMCGSAGCNELERDLLRAAAAAAPARSCGNELSDLAGNFFVDLGLTALGLGAVKVVVRGGLEMASGALVRVLAGSVKTMGFWQGRRGWGMVRGLMRAGATQSALGQVAGGVGAVETLHVWEPSVGATVAAVANDLADALPWVPTAKAASAYLRCVSGR
jgi:RHS repeat-associated protein